MKYSSRSATIGMRGRPGTLRINTDVFLGISAASFVYSEIENISCEIKTFPKKTPSLFLHKLFSYA
jgi:hypothetical protein